MGAFFQRKPVRKFLTAFKWCRIALLFAVFIVVVVLSYLHLVGLPNIVKKPLLRALRQRGIEAEFASARLGWGPSILIENAAFSSTNQSPGPRLSASWTDLHLVSSQLLRGRLRVDSFDVVQASVTIPVSPTNREPLELTDVNLVVDLSSNNVVVTNGTAWCRGVTIHLNGEISEFPSMLRWKFSMPSITAPPGPGTGPTQPGPATRRRSPWEMLQTVRFKGKPELNLHFTADGRDRNTLRAELDFTADGTETDWGRAGHLELRAACARILSSGGAPFFRAHVQARDVSTRWASGRTVSGSIDFSREAATNLAAFAHLAIHDASAAWASPSGSNWVRVADLQWDGGSSLPSPTFRPETLHGTLTAKQAASDSGSVDAASFVLQARRSEDSLPPDPSWGAWNKLKPFIVDCQVEATNLLTPQLKLDQVAFHGGWHSPEFIIDKLQAVMLRGHLDIDGKVDVASREAQARVALDFDPHQISTLFSSSAQHWISLYNWETPPQFSADLRCILPPWTNRLDNWPEESRNSLQLAGDFSVGRGAFRGIAVNSAQSHYAYSNHVWSVSGLRVEGEGGSVGLDYGWDDATGDYHFQFDSELDPAVAAPLLTAAGQSTLAEFHFPEKPKIHGELWGNWSDAATIGFTAAVTASHFAVRGEAVDQIGARFDFTNRLLRICDLKLARHEGRVEVPLASIDFNSNAYSMSNASSTIDPEAVRRALGKIAPPWMKELQFASPPLVTATGSFTPGHDEGTDLRFFVKGQSLHWERFTSDSVQGDVYYHFRTVQVTNVLAGFYKTGKVQGDFTIEWERHGTRFQSEANLSNINLAQFAQELTHKRSKVEGILDGHLSLGAPYDANPTNFYGNGWLHVHDGLLWDIKLFGMLSPILNAIAPGSGQSRAREARASFTITNGVLDTEDLEIRSSGFRLLYRGTLDSKTRLNARVEAKLLRDTPVFGHFFSWMLLPLDQLFEYGVTGTLDKPVTKPLHIPKVFVELLHPFHTLKQEMRQSPSPPPKPKSTQLQN